VGDLVSRDRLHDSAIGALQLAFDYARAQAVLLRAGDGNQTAPPAEGETASNIDQLDARTDQRVATLQAKLNDLNTALAHATARSREALAAQRDAVEDTAKKNDPGKHEMPPVICHPRGGGRPPGRPPPPQNPPPPGKAPQSPPTPSPPRQRDRPAATTTACRRPPHQPRRRLRR